jgi:hypothetical protein
MGLGWAQAIGPLLDSHLGMRLTVAKVSGNGHNLPWWLYKFVPSKEK